MLFSLPYELCGHCGFDQHKGDCLKEDLDRATFLRKPYTDAIGLASAAISETGVCIDDQPNYPTVIVKFLLSRISELEEQMRIISDCA